MLLHSVYGVIVSQTDDWRIEAVAQRRKKEKPLWTSSYPFNLHELVGNPHSPQSLLFIFPEQL